MRPVRVGCWLVVVTLLMARPSAYAETARDLLDRARELGTTTRKWTDRTQRLQLTIVDRRGSERKRDLEIYLKKFADDASRTIVFFQSPAEIKGTGFLQWANPHGSDEQWLYLPELKRVRQISGGSKRESFVGTDFSYEDLAIFGQIADWTEADATTELVAEEAIDGEATAVIAFTPAGKEIGYSQIRGWLRRSDLVMVKYEFRDKKGAVAKELRAKDIRLVGAIPTAFRLEMRNVPGGSHTDVQFIEVTYDTGLSDRGFTQRSLERGSM